MQTYVQYCGEFFTFSELEIIFNIFLGDGMGRIKMNLDMLEEVRLQHEAALSATEDVINKGKIKGEIEENGESEDDEEG